MPGRHLLAVASLLVALSACGADPVEQVMERYWAANGSTDGLETCDDVIEAEARGEPVRPVYEEFVLSAIEDGRLPADTDVDSAVVRVEEWLREKCSGYDRPTR